jgi:hypothetical protein
VNDNPQTDLLKHVATISTGASVVVVALRSELVSVAVSFSLVLFSLSLVISMGALALKASFYGLLGEDVTTYKGIGVVSVLAYLLFIGGALVLVGSLLL